MYWYFPHHRNRIPGRNNLREETFILAHGFRDSRPSWWEGGVTEQNSSQHGSQEAEKRQYKKKPS
jgi:hypothetical protein